MPPLVGLKETPLQLRRRLVLSSYVVAFETASSYIGKLNGSGELKRPQYRTFENEAALFSELAAKRCSPTPPVSLSRQEHSNLSSSPGERRTQLAWFVPLATKARVCLLNSIL